ncbi:hypothetical protein LJR231_002781 [Phyllobacterium sp. LjRoot231]|uniref:hypothetical protein n=1 Tax=Phyllobacterium sp. LjRoot231 TaxID=3342289 RepID=UPI003ECD0C22
MHSSVSTEFVYTFDVSSYEEDWLEQHFFPPSGAPCLGSNRLIFNRTVYYERFFHIVGTVDSTVRHRRAVKQVEKNYGLIELYENTEGQLFKKNLSFGLSLGETPFRLAALEEMHVTGFYRGATFIAGLGGFLAPTKSGFDPAVEIRLTLANGNISPTTQRLLSFVSWTEEQHVAMQEVTKTVLPELKHVHLDVSFAPNHEASTTFDACWKSATAQ